MFLKFVNRDPPTLPHTMALKLPPFYHQLYCLWVLITNLVSAMRLQCLHLFAELTPLFSTHYNRNVSTRIS
jgi:hypothetical protein